jgi:Domain of Unknown Function (DUF1206)
MSVTVDKAGQGARRATGNPVYRLLARAGYVARGVLYAYMGYAALRIALTGVPQRADQQAGLLAVAGFPLGRVILTAGVTAIAAYALWGFIRAVYDPLHRGKDPVGIVTRLGFAWSGLTYTALLFFTLGLLARGSGTGGGDVVQSLAALLLGAPFGVLLLEGAGLVGVGAGIGQFVEAGRATFKRDERRAEMSGAEKRLTDALGRAGFVARGVVFSLMGWFLLLAGVHRDPHHAAGFTGTFTYFLAQPYGRVLLSLVAAGFLALGLHSVVLARYIRLPGEGAAG